MSKWTVLCALLVSLPVLAFAQAVDRTGDLIIDHARDMQVVTPRAAGSLDETWAHMDPGVAPEGDYIGGSAFTPDGSRMLLCNRMTDNITIFDWQSMQPLANVSVGRYPAAVAATNNIAVVACAFGNKVYFIDLNDYSVLDSLDAAEQPWVVHISPDSHYVYVACDIPNVCEVYDLTTRQHVRSIQNFPISLTTFSFNSASGRSDAVFTDFVITPDGAHLIASRCDSVLLFINSATGEVDDSILGIRHCAVLGLSGDSTKLIAVSPITPPVAYQIDMATRTILDSVSFSGTTMLMTYQVGVNQDGSKCYLGISDNQSAIVRFATHDFVTLNACYTAFWIGTTPDHRYAISGQFNFCMVDFETESVVSHLTGHGQYHGVVAPSGNRVVAYDPFNYEGPYFYDVTTPSNAQYLGKTPSGLFPEGDAPRFAAIAPDGSKAVCSNFLSNNLSIMNLSTQQTEAVVDAGDTPWEVAITPDSRYAVLCGFNTNSVQIVDLASDSVVADVPAGGRPAVVSISPNGDFAYVGNVLGNTVSVIALDGASSAEVTQIPCGEIGAVWASYGVSSDVEVSPSGRWVLVAASFDDFVHVIDTETNSEVALLAVGDFPLNIAFCGDDSLAVVTNYFGNSVSCLHIDGAASSVTGTYAVGNGPLRLAYDPATDQVGIGLYTAMQVKKINPHTGATMATHNFAQYGNVAGVAYDALGNEVVLTAGSGNVASQLHRGIDHTELPATPASFTLGTTGQLAAVAMPGPDFVTLVDYGTPNAAHARTISPALSFAISAAYPNPFNPAVTVRYTLPKDASVALRAFDALGREAATLFEGRQGSGEHQIVWDAHGLPSGPYWIRLEASGAGAVRKVVLLK
ncbi:MAG TPA: beta-propeller fold lactonase family protein [bacterium]|jgi:YVTN family beta-propeller protein